jgi:hypothetical protein
MRARIWVAAGSGLARSWWMRRLNLIALRSCCRLQRANNQQILQRSARSSTVSAKSLPGRSPELVTRCSGVAQSSRQIRRRLTPSSAQRQWLSAASVKVLVICVGSSRRLNSFFSDRGHTFVFLRSCHCHMRPLGNEWASKPRVVNPWGQSFVLRAHAATHRKIEGVPPATDRNSTVRGETSRDRGGVIPRAALMRSFGLSGACGDCKGLLLDEQHPRL